MPGSTVDEPCVVPPVAAATVATNSSSAHVKAARKPAVSPQDDSSSIAAIVEAHALSRARRTRSLAPPVRQAQQAQPLTKVLQRRRSRSLVRLSKEDSLSGDRRLVQARSSSVQLEGLRQRRRRLEVKTCQGADQSSRLFATAASPNPRSSSGYTGLSGDRSRSNETAGGAASAGPSNNQRMPTSKPSAVLPFHPEDEDGFAEEDESGERIKDPRIRWAVLALACMVMFGNFYAYDLPASLNKPLQSFLGTNDQAYQYQLNLFYSLYSLPNVILPFFGGWLVDAFGTRRLMTILSSLVCLGQFLFAVGVQTKVYWVMHLGRIIFGVGGESLSVAQTRLTTKWFKGKELAFALGVNLSVARLGSVFNDFLSPYLGIYVSIPFSVWFGFIFCLLSLVCGLILNHIDEKGVTRSARHGHHMQSYRMTATSSSSSVDVSHPHGSVVHPPPLAHTNSAHSLRNARRSMMLEREDSNAAIAFGPGGRTQGFGSSPPGGHHGVTGTLDWKAVSEFTLPFWLICLIMCLMYATVIPFNTIHSAFLQNRWYPNDPATAAQVMAIPDIISATLVPFCGTFVDRYGRRSKVLIFCGCIMAVVHLILAFATRQMISSPLLLLCMLGFSYALLLTFWPCIPLVVKEKSLATAFGIATATQNASLTVFPIVVAALVNSDPTFLRTELFFFALSFVGVALTIYLHVYDVQHLNSVLDNPSVSHSRRLRGRLFHPPGTVPETVGEESETGASGGSSRADLAAAGTALPPSPIPPPPVVGIRIPGVFTEDDEILEQILEEDELFELDLDMDLEEGSERDGAAEVEAGRGHYLD
ncbi:major facilitator superfamily domain-containing protein [Zopfochytrium polystomum]|nr:major facilitator superfamily domain-containing protein [Zopfochytrium polystomum]